MTLAREIAANAPIAVRLAKKALYKGDADLLDAAIAIESEYQAYTWTTEDAREGITAMTEKRTPKFRGK
jgi:enoyl-CoA hydratase/carnithine racemase